MRKIDQVFNDKQSWPAPNPIHFPKGRDASGATTVTAGWYRDPLGSEQFRYWAGNTWSHDIITAGVIAAEGEHTVVLDKQTDEVLSATEKRFNNKQPWEPPTQTSPSPVISARPQRICIQCGASLDFDASFCPKCGAKQPELTTTELASVIAQVQQQASAKKPEDTERNFGFAVLGFLVPVVGLILYALWYKDRPGPAKSAGTGAIAGVVTGVVIWLIYLIAMTSITRSAFGALG